ncbi:unnamed protein product [Acidithrix sp. C25]|nr:unnamed protein product [Acidithrix sp. C25]
MRSRWGISDSGGFVRFWRRSETILISRELFAFAMTVVRIVKGVVIG